MRSIISTFVIAAIVIVSDQATKLWAVQTLKDSADIQAIPYILSFTYVENRGAAFGMGQNLRWLFVAVSIVFIVIFCIALFKYKRQNLMVSISAGLILGGTVGNLIDRVLNGYVVDFLQLSFFPPTCNIADYSLTIGVVLLVIYMLFFTDALKSDNPGGKDGNQKYIDGN
ncbi:MAG: signal peptidase II [Clostridia bacterium]|nr:signal peptidase II [Clostridia bacterium]